MTSTGTLYQQIARWASEKPNAGALFTLDDGGNLVKTTWKEYLQAVREIARGLMALGVKKGDSVALLAKNRPQWVMCQHGIAAAGAVPAPIYVTNLADQVAYIVNYSESKVMILDEQIQLDKCEESMANGDIDLDKIITFTDLGSSNDKVMTLDALRAKASEVPESQLDELLAAVQPDDVTLRIYTSGTTGKPKGAEYTHRGIEVVVNGSMELFGDHLGGDARAVSYLPLCHVAEQIFTNYIGLQTGAEVYFCPELPSLKDYLVAGKPTYMLGVPRVWEKFEAALQARLAQATGLRASLAKWALATEKAAMQKEIDTGRPYSSIARSIARSLVINKIQEAVGISSVQLAASGAAPISRSTLEFFQSIGLLIHEGYGMTETSGVATAQPPLRPRFGTVGIAIPGVEVRIAEDGEIMLKGDNMIPGYHKMPEKSAELYTAEWMHTGDLGAIDKDGFLTITGRKKDLLITAGGKNVGPAEMENHLLSITGIGQAVAVGDRKPYLCALLVLDPETLPAMLAEAGLDTSMTAEQAANHEGLKAWLTDQVKTKCNDHVARYQQIKYFTVMPEPFTVETGELTPTMKIKRNVVHEKYADTIESMYAGKVAPKQAAAPAE